MTDAAACGSCNNVPYDKTDGLYCCHDTILMAEAKNCMACGTIGYDARSEVECMDQERSILVRLENKPRTVRCGQYVTAPWKEYCCQPEVGQIVPYPALHGPSPSDCDRCGDKVYNPNIHQCCKITSDNPSGLIDRRRQKCCLWMLTPLHRQKIRRVDYLIRDAHDESCMTNQQRRAAACASRRTNRALQFCCDNIVVTSSTHKPDCQPRQPLIY